MTLVGRVLSFALFKMPRAVASAPRRRRPAQLGLVFSPAPRRPGWGGARAGAGRPRSPANPVPHRTRPALASRYPVHVTLRVADDLPSLRTPALRRLLEDCFRDARDAVDGFRLAHYAIQRHHLHLLVEATDAPRLARGMQGLGARLARRLNTALARQGRVVVERYFARILRTPREVHRCLRYVLQNARRHDAQRGRVHEAGWLDPCSSACWFDGWRTPVAPPAGRAPPVAEPRTWLLAHGWRRHGLLDACDTPGPLRGQARASS